MQTVTAVSRRWHSICTHTQPARSLIMVLSRKQGAALRSAQRGDGTLQCDHGSGQGLQPCTKRICQHLALHDGIMEGGMLKERMQAMHTRHCSGHGVFFEQGLQGSAGPVGISPPGLPGLGAKYGGLWCADARGRCPCIQLLHQRWVVEQANRSTLKGLSRCHVSANALPWRTP